MCDRAYAPSGIEAAALTPRRPDPILLERQELRCLTETRIQRSRAGEARHLPTKTEIAAYVSALWALGLLQELELVADPGLDRDGQALSFSVSDKRVRVRAQLNNKF